MTTPAIRPRHRHRPLWRRASRARITLLLVVLLGVLLGILLVGWSPPAAAQPAPPPDSPGAPTVRGGCDRMSGPIGVACRLPKPLQALGDAATAPARALGESALQALAAAVISGTKYLLEQVGKQITTTTTTEINLRAAWFTGFHRTAYTLAAAVAALMLLIELAVNAVRGNVGAMLLAAFVYLPAAAITGAVAPAVTQLLVAAADGIASAMGQDMGADGARFLTHDVGSWLGAVGGATRQPSIPVFVTLLIALLGALGALAVWLELLLRSALVYLSVAFMPLLFAMLVWDAARKYVRRAVEFTVAVIFTKPPIVAAAAMGAEAARTLPSFNDAAAGRGGLGKAVIGVALLLLAAFVPWLLLRVLPPLEGVVAGAVGQRRTLREGTPTNPLPASDLVRQTLYTNLFYGGFPGRGGFVPPRAARQVASAAPAPAPWTPPRPPAPPTTPPTPPAGGSPPPSHPASPHPPRPPRPPRPPEPPTHPITPPPPPPPPPPTPPSRE